MVPDTYADWYVWWCERKVSELITYLLLDQYIM